MDNGGIFMTKKERFKYELVSEFLNGKMKRREVASLLQIRERTVSRLARKIESAGLFGVVHASRGKCPANKTKAKVRSTAMQLVRTKYYDFNMTHCLEILRDKHKIELAYTTFRRMCHKEKLVKREKRRRKKVHSLRARMPSEGLLLQMDGSHHHWNRKDMWVLVGAIDDATSDIPHAEFFTYEGTLPCMTVVRKIVETRGVPVALYVDKAEWFGGGTKMANTQFERACSELGIKIIFAHSPQAKGRIERVWGTLQDRLVPELRLKGIQTIPEANKYLQKEFLPKYWKVKNTVIARSPEVKYRPLPKGLNLDEIFCMKEYRKVKNDHSLRWKGRVYALDPRQFKHSIAGQSIEIRLYENNIWKVYFAGEEIKVIRDKIEIHSKVAA